MKVLIVLAGLLYLAYGAVQIPVHRLIQYEYEGTHLGSQVSSLNYLGAHYENSEEISRKCTVIHISKLSIDTLESILSYKPSALLIILGENQSEGLKEIESYLGTNSFPFPIYFTQETTEITSIYKELLLQKGEQSSDSDQLQFALSTDEKSVAKGLNQENFYGFVYEYSETLPTIALETNYDAFGIVPELANGMDANGSGVIAVLELAKYFRKLFTQSPPAYNLLLLVTSTGSLNHQGLRSWLDSEDAELQQLIGNIGFALCLDSLGKGKELSFHISRFHKDTEIDAAKLYADFNNTSSLVGIPLSYTKKKVNMADPFVPWAHENFAKKKLISATLSHLSVAATSIIDKSSIYDSKANLDTESLEKNIRFIAESLTRFLYNLNDPNLVVYNKQDLTSQESINNWVETFANYTRFPTKLTPGSEFTKLLKESLSNITNTPVKTQKYQVTDYTLYNTKVETMSIYKVKPAILDLYIFIGIIGYIAVLYGVLKVFGGISFTKEKSKKS